MSPDKALELVGRYARLTHSIKACKDRIGAELDKCPGLKGFRLETERHEAIPGNRFFDPIEAHDAPTERAQQDQETHLSVWYGKEYGEMVYRYQDDHEFKRWPVRAAIEGEACPACYAAHLIVQERKELRRQLAHVKGAMTRSVPASEGV